MGDVLKIGVLGLGTVGGSVVRILKENEGVITARAGKKIEVVSGATREPESAKEYIKEQFPSESECRCLAELHFRTLAEPGQHV